LALYERRGAARAQAGQTQGAIADMRRVIDALRAGGERAKTRDALIQLGMAYRHADQYEEATVCLTEALRESRLMNDERHAADTLYHLGTVAWSTGKNSQAIGFHQQAVEICERAGFTDLVAVQAWHGRAAAHFEAALEIARAADLQWHFGPTLLGLDHVRACTGRYGEAWTGMQKTLGWLESLRQTRYQFIAYDFIGHLPLDLGLNELAIEHLERGLALGRDTGILFWRAGIDAHLAVARSRLGQTGVAPALQATLEQTRRASERYMMVRCIDGLAEIARAAGDARGCRAYADELLALAEADGLRELEAVARRWRGEAMFVEQDYAAAQAELSRAAALAEDIGRVRLQLDAQAALARLLATQGQRDAAQRHDAAARAIAQAIGKSLESSGLEARLRMN